MHCTDRKAACSLQAPVISYFRSETKMTAVSDVNLPLVSKCMDFCQALASQGQTFHFSLNMGPTFSFSLDTRGKAMKGPVKKKESPSTQRRNARRREEFLSKKRQTFSTVDSTVEKAAVSSFPCDQCDYTNASERGLRQHQRMKHGKPQLDAQLQSSSPSTPETMRKPTSYSDALAVSPIEDSTRAIPCNNCDEDMLPNHICPTYKCWAPVDGCDEAFNCEEDLKNHIDYDHSSTICHNCKGEFWEQDFEACPACSCVWP